MSEQGRTATCPDCEDKPCEWDHTQSPVGRECCTTCDGEGTVPVNYPDCPEQPLPAYQPLPDEDDS